jgi:hypothetical protein
VRRADRECRRTHARIFRISRELGRLVVAARRGQVGPDDYYSRSSAATDELARAGEQAVARLRALPAPRGDRRLSRYLALSGEQARLLHLQAAALRRRDGARLRALVARTLSLSRRSRRLARAYGFRSCGGPGAG